MLPWLSVKAETIWTHSYFLQFQKRIQIGNGRAYYLEATPKYHHRLTAVMRVTASGTFEREVLVTHDLFRVVELPVLLLVECFRGSSLSIPSTISLESSVLANKARVFPLRSYIFGHCPILFSNMHMILLFNSSILAIKLTSYSIYEKPMCIVTRRREYVMFVLDFTWKQRVCMCVRV